MSELHFLFQTPPGFRGVTDEFEFLAKSSDEAIRNIVQLWNGAGIAPDEGEAFILVKFKFADEIEDVPLGDFRKGSEGNYFFYLSEENPDLIDLLAEKGLSYEDTQESDLDSLKSILNILFKSEDN